MAPRLTHNTGTYVSTSSALSGVTRVSAKERCEGKPNAHHGDVKERPARLRRVLGPGAWEGKQATLPKLLANTGTYISTPSRALVRPNPAHSCGEGEITNASPMFKETPGAEASRVFVE